MCRSSLRMAATFTTVINPTSFPFGHRVVI